MGIARIASIKSTMASEQNNFAMRGVLEGHSGWVTSIATTNENPEMILSASRDKTVMVWQITGEDMKYGAPKKALRGHGHFVQDVVIVGRAVRPLRLLGRPPPPLGPQHWPHHSSLRRTQQGRPFRRLLGRQPPDRVGVAGQDHQALEHP